MFCFQWSRVTLNLDFKVTGTDALDVLCAQLTRDLFAIATFLLVILLVVRQLKAYFGLFVLMFDDRCDVAVICQLAADSIRVGAWASYIVVLQLQLCIRIRRFVHRRQTDVMFATGVVFERCQISVVCALRLDIRLIGAVRRRLFLFDIARRRTWQWDYVRRHWSGAVVDQLQISDVLDRGRRSDILVVVAANRL